MLEDIVIPQLGETADEEVIITGWKKKEGQKVEKGEVLLELEMGKGVMELESLYTGTLVEILVREKDIVYPLAVVGRIKCEQG